MKAVHVLTIVLMLYMHWYSPDLEFWGTFSLAVSWMLYGVSAERSIKLRDGLLDTYKRDLWHTKIKLKKAEKNNKNI